MLINEDPLNSEINLFSQGRAVTLLPASKITVVSHKFFKFSVKFPNPREESGSLSYQSFFYLEKPNPSLIFHL